MHILGFQMKMLSLLQCPLLLPQNRSHWGKNRPHWPALDWAAPTGDQWAEGHQQGSLQPSWSDIKDHQERSGSAKQALAYSKSVNHRVGRVLSFFSSRRNWGMGLPSTRPFSRRRVLLVRGEGHTRLRERGWGSPNSDETECVSRYQCFILLIIFNCKLPKRKFEVWKIRLIEGNAKCRHCWSLQGYISYNPSSNRAEAKTEWYYSTWPVNLPIAVRGFSSPPIIIDLLHINSRHTNTS